MMGLPEQPSPTALGAEPGLASSQGGHSGSWSTQLGAEAERTKAEVSM